MGHHLHSYLAQTVAFALAALVTGGVFALLGGAWWETHRRRHGFRSKQGSRRAIVTARFASSLD